MAQLFDKPPFSYLLPEDAVMAAALHFSCLAAESIVNQEGKIEESGIKEAKEFLYSHSRFFPFELELSPLIVSMNNRLTQLSKELIAKIHSLHKGAVHSLFFSYIKPLFPNEKSEERLLRLGIISSCLMPIRQTVGSCFATAPAILIHEEQLYGYISDLLEMMKTGRLRRVAQQKEHFAPVTYAIGTGILDKSYPEILLKNFCAVHQIHYAPSTTYKELLTKTANKSLESFVILLTEHPLLRFWEFTLASFSDAESHSARYTMANLLGLTAGASDGLGSFIKEFLEEKLRLSNDQLSSLQSQYEHAFLRVKMGESLLQQATSIESARRAKQELEGNYAHFKALEEMRNEASEIGSKIQELYELIISHLFSSIPLYFAELFDPNIRAHSAAIYQDSPAGFRLYIKGFSSDSRGWVPISSWTEYEKALVEFFLLLEPRVYEQIEWKKGKELLSELFTHLIQKIRIESFQKTIEKKAQQFHKQQHATPWSFEAGGTIHTLLSVYYKKSSGFTEEKRSVHSCEEYAVFLLDTLKSSHFDPLQSRRLLATTPVHAFTLLPHMPLFSKGWNDRGFSYTYVRDHLVAPCKALYEQEKLPSNKTFFPTFPTSSGDLPLFSLRSLLSEGVDTRGVESALRRHFPVITEELVSPFFSDFPPINKITQKQILEKLPLGCGEFFLLIRSVLDGVLPLEPLISLLLQHHLLPPQGCVFADTNWPHWWFTLLPSPITGELSLWRTDRFGLFGVPMREWDPFFKGEGEFSIFSNPAEYLYDNSAPVWIQGKKA